MWDIIYNAWPIVVALTNSAICILATAHALMNRRDTRAVIAWVGLIWLVPFLGVLLYVAFGVNRIRRRAQLLRGDLLPAERAADVSFYHPAGLDAVFGQQYGHLAPLVQLVGTLTQRSLLPGNRVTPLMDGDETYPEMIRAIEQAERSITLSTYIFDNDRAGDMFLEALAAARQRGVEIRILIDDIGARYSRPSMDVRLEQAGLKVSRFLPIRVPRLFHYANLRNHRKIMVVDGCVGFTGGMNIREGHQRELNTPYTVSDLHFRIDGPAVSHLQTVFVADWTFSTGEVLNGGAWFPTIAPSGPVLARGVAHGPDEDFEKLQLTMMGALAAARSSVDIVTPYFLPDASLITALNVCALQGVKVRILLPRHNNVVLVQWACDSILWQVLDHGCHVWKSPPPFDHSKLMIVDQCWSLIGSSNWDPRSLRLNFEFNLECYDRELAARLTQHVEACIQTSRETTLKDIEGRPLAVKLRDGVANLFTPYL